MVNIVYVDVYFCFNFLMDFFVLYAIRLTLKEGGLSIKDIAAALVGAIYSTFVLMFENYNFLQIIFTYIVIPIVMILITTQIHNLKQLTKRIGVLYLFTFIISGIINVIYYGSLTSKEILEKALQMQIGQLSIWVIATVIIMIISTIKFFGEFIIKSYIAKQNLYDVLIQIGDYSINAKGLMDTGNQLIEPVTGKAVFIIENDLVKHIEKNLLKPVFIPFSSVGKEHGLMEGFIGSKIKVKGRIIEKPIIGIHNGKLSRENKYNMILPPNI